MLILAFEANSALFRKNETKIVKFTHSASLDLTAESSSKVVSFKVDLRSTSILPILDARVS